MKRLLAFSFVCLGHVCLAQAPPAAPEEDTRLVAAFKNYLDEERFARAFAGGKFRVKKWGRVKIMMELKARKVSPHCINAAMQEIDKNAYHETLVKLVDEKQASLKEKNLFTSNHKTATYLIGKGYEPDLVWEILRG